MQRFGVIADSQCRCRWNCEGIASIGIDALVVVVGGAVGVVSKDIDINGGVLRGNDDVILGSETERSGSGRWDGSAIPRLGGIADRSRSGSLRGKTVESDGNITKGTDQHLVEGVLMLLNDILRVRLAEQIDKVGASIDSIVGIDGVAVVDILLGKSMPGTVSIYMAAIEIIVAESTRSKGWSCAFDGRVLNLSLLAMGR